MTAKNKFPLQLVRSAPDKEVIEEPDSSVKDFAGGWKVGRINFILQYSGRGPFPGHTRRKLTNTPCGIVPGKEKKKEGKGEKEENTTPNDKLVFVLGMPLKVGPQCNGVCLSQGTCPLPMTG